MTKPWATAAVVTPVFAQEHSAGPEESGSDELHRVVRRGVRGARARRGAARGSAGRATIFRGTRARTAHAATTDIQPRRRQHHWYSNNYPLRFSKSLEQKFIRRGISAQG